jgi:hypothetical protein
MADDEKPKGDPGDKKQEPGPGPGETAVGWLGIVGLTGYLVGLALFLAFNLVAHWPTGACPSDPVAPSSTAPTSTTLATVPPSPSPEPKPCVTIRGQALAYGSEGRLLFIVVFAAALGGTLHALRSLYWYVGNREFRQSWVLSYLLLPWTGSIVGLLIYFLLRAGLLSGATSVENTNVFGIAAIGSLAGLFSQQAVLKLKQVFETLWTPPAEGKNSVPQGAAPPPKPAPPTVTAVASPTSAPTAQKLSVRGTGFKKPMTVTLTAPNSNEGTTVPAEAVELTSDTACEVTATLSKGGEWTIVVHNGDGQASAPFKFTAK